MSRAKNYMMWTVHNNIVETSYFNGSRLWSLLTLGWGLVYIGIIVDMSESQRSTVILQKLYNFCKIRVDHLDSGILTVILNIDIRYKIQAIRHNWCFNRRQNLCTPLLTPLSRSSSQVTLIGNHSVYFICVGWRPWKVESDDGWDMRENGWRSAGRGCCCWRREIVMCS
jgi:hypothetical protein